MKKPIIAVDIDDVLSLTVEKILAFGNDRWGHDHTHDDFTEHLQDMWQVGDDEARTRWYEYMNSGVIGTYNVVPTAKEVLGRLRNRYQIIAVTSRRESLLDITNQWLDQHYPGLLDQVISAGIYGLNMPNAHTLTKAGVLQRIGARYLIDDQPKHCIGADSVGVTAILFGGYPWNIKAEVPPSVVRLNDWNAIEEYFHEQA